MLEPLLETDSLDGFFFPSSPLFGADSPNSVVGVENGQQQQQQLPAHFDADFMLQPSMHFQQQQQQQQHVKPSLHSYMHAPSSELSLADPFIQSPVVPQQQQQHYTLQWPEQVAPHTFHVAQHTQPPQQQQQYMQQQQFLPVHQSRMNEYSSQSSQASQDASSGHSTPTLVPHSPMGPASSSSSVTASPTSTASTPSLLSQFSCTVPESNNNALFKSSTTAAASTTGRSTTTKRERKVAATTRAKKNAGSAASSTTHSPSSSMSLLNVPQVHGGYISDSSSSRGTPSSLASTSPCPPSATSFVDVDAEQDTNENNEPHPADDEETKKRKLARKAELARLSRKRKKTRLNDLEAEVRRLEEELARVKRGKIAPTELAAAVDPDQVCAGKMQHVISSMSVAVQHGLTAGCSTPQPTSSRTPALTGADALCRSQPTVLTPLIDEYMSQFNQHTSNCMQHLQALQEHHVKPMRTFEFLGELMKQQHDSASSPWARLLSRELELTPSCREYGELEAFRTSTSAQHNFDSEIDRAYSKLQTLLHKRATQQAKNLNRIRAIFNEKQFVKYIEWSHRQQQQPMPKMEMQAAMPQVYQQQQQTDAAAANHYAQQQLSYSIKAEPQYM